MENISCVGDLSKVLLDNYDGDWHLYFYKASNRKYKTKKIDISDDLIRGINMLRDNQNDAVDDSDQLARMIQNYTNTAFKRLMRGNQNNTDNNE